jgi:hypothetical protein
MTALRQKRSFEHTACPTISIADIRANTLQLRFHFHNGEATKHASVIRSHSPEFSHRIRLRNVADFSDRCDVAIHQ